MTRGNDDDDRIRALEKQRIRLSNEIRRLGSKQAETRRKREIRRRFLAGDVALTYAAKNADFAQAFFKILDASIKGSDRGLFELDSELKTAFTYAAEDYRKDKSNHVAKGSKPKP